MMNFKHGDTIPGLDGMVFLRFDNNVLVATSDQAFAGNTHFPEKRYWRDSGGHWVPLPGSA